MDYTDFEIAVNALYQVYDESKSAGERAKEEDKVNNILFEILKNEYSIPPAVASVVIAKAKEDGHAYGWYEVLSKAQTYAEFAEEILEAANEPRN